MLTKSTLLAFFVSTMFGFSAQANELQSAEAQVLAESLKREIGNTLAEIHRLEQKQAGDSKPLAITLSQPEFSFVELGLVLDPQSKTVLSVNPNSNADALGLRVGDRIQSMRVDGKVINDFPNNVTLNSGSVIQADVQRGGNEDSLLLETVAKSKTIPAWSLQVSSSEPSPSTTELSGCGYVSVFFTPPGTKYQYPAKVFEVDGESGFHLRETIKLPAGQHTLKVHEYIPEQMLPRRKSGIEKAKSLDLLIEPNKTYHIAAQFEPEKRLQLVNESYWEPVVWKVTESKCRP